MNKSKSLDELGGRDSWVGIRVAVLGLGVSGFAAADTLVDLGASVTVWAPEASSPYAPLLRALGVRHEISALSVNLAKNLSDSDLVVVSPGIAPEHELIQQIRGRVPVWSEVELGWRIRDRIQACPWFLVTGTNGKTSTVSLTASFLQAAGFRATACGNIGYPVLDALRRPQGWDYLVVELSSHQLAWLPESGPGAVFGYSTVCLNLAQDHLAWHGAYDKYRLAKARVYSGTEAYCLYNRDDPLTEELLRGAEVVSGARAVGFGLGLPSVGELGLAGEILCDRAFIDNRRTRALELIDLAVLAGQGLAAPHNIANVLAAAGLVRSVGVQPEAIAAGIRSFSLPAHRAEVVARLREVLWVDDSKATNSHAARASLGLFNPVVWIVGGDLKGVDLGELIDFARPRLRAVVLIGVDSQNLKTLFERLPTPLRVIEPGEAVMRRAVLTAAELAKPGDTVLLAPAAASWDQFIDYAERGRLFQEAVSDYALGEGP